MAPFKFGKGKNTEKFGNDSTVSSDDLIDQTSEDTISDSEEQIETALSFHPSWSISSEEKYVYQFLNLDEKPLKPNQISISGIKIDNQEQQVVVTAFVRSSLNKPIHLGQTTLLLMNEDKETLAQKPFNLAELGEIPAKSSRPWHFVFEKPFLSGLDIPEKNWTLAFQLNSKREKHQLDLEKSWNESLSETDKEKLVNLVEKIDAPKPGEVNFMGLSAGRNENGDLRVTLLIRNGSEKNVNLEKLPLEVEDATGEIVARGGFTFDDFTVKANTSKPWTFIFPKSLLTKEDMDLSKWKVKLPQ
jgi:accessory Sec system S-layer assembly protein